MTHVVVTRVLVLLTAAWIGAAMLFAWRLSLAPAEPSTEPAVAANPTPGDAAATFERRCGACHLAADLAVGLRAKPDPAARGRTLDSLLEGHGSATDAERAVLVAYLVDLVGR